MPPKKGAAKATKDAEAQEGAKMEVASEPARTKRTARGKAKSETAEEADVAEEAPVAPAAKGKGKRAKTEKAEEKEEAPAAAAAAAATEEEKPKAKGRGKKAAADEEAPKEKEEKLKKGKADKAAAVEEVKEEIEKAVEKVKKTKATLEKKVSMGLPRGLTPRAAAVAGALTIISWNVNGLRSVIKAAKDALTDLVKKYSPDILVLQETKLQDGQGPGLGTLLPGYSAHWTYSIKQKGYAGSVAFVRDSLKTCPVTFSIGAKHDGEGRVITVEHPAFYLVSLYVPNSGQKLERLSYRVNEWDPDLLAYLKNLEKTKPVVFTGDLNVAHLDQDIYNYQAKHISKVAGCTPQERSSFTRILGAGFVDTFRRLHPDVRGVFTYWSARTHGRVDNKGLRLDYFIASQSMYDPDAKCRVVDSIVLDDEGRVGDVDLSDHCPILLNVHVKP